MKQIPIEFLEIVQNDINRIDALTGNQFTESAMRELHREIDGRYQACIIEWGKSMWGYIAKHGFSYSMLGEQSLYDNLKMMKSKLETYRYQVNAVPHMMPPSTNITVSVDNRINIQTTFNMVRSRLDEDPALTPEQTAEAKSKVDEIEKIVTSSESKKKKWEKVKPLLIWLADKSVDIGIAFLPLILKI